MRFYGGFCCFCLWGFFLFDCSLFVCVWLFLKNSLGNITETELVMGKSIL